MPLPFPAKKPLLLIFPFAQPIYYGRCLLLANYLRRLFDIHFLHSNAFASLIYQQGFDTFSGHSFFIHGFENNSKEPISYETKLEMQFLELVELLETLQPSIVLGDGMNALGMAAEFTGIPFISLFNGYQSPYFIHNSLETGLLRTHEPHRLLREKYGLREKHTWQEESEGDLNWICDLPELFPQKELPQHYETKGPLVTTQKMDTLPSKSIFPYSLNPFKKTILLDIDNMEQVLRQGLLNNHTWDFNLVVESSRKGADSLQGIRGLYFVNTAEILPQIDLLLCSTKRMIYPTLSHGIPILFAKTDQYHECIIQALKHWNIGTDWDLAPSRSTSPDLNFWTNKKGSVTLCTMQYKILTASAMLKNRLFQSLNLHFPQLVKALASLS